MEMEFIPLKTPDGSLIGHARVRDGQVALSLKRPGLGRAVILTDAGLISAVAGGSTACPGRVNACALHDNGRLVGYGISRNAKLTSAELRRRLMLLAAEQQKPAPKTVSAGQAPLPASHPSKNEPEQGRRATPAATAEEIPHISPPKPISFPDTGENSPRKPFSVSETQVFPPQSPTGFSARGSAPTPEDRRLGNNDPVPQAGAARTVQASGSAAQWEAGPDVETQAERAFRAAPAQRPQPGAASQEAPYAAGDPQGPESRWETRSAPGEEAWRRQENGEGVLFHAPSPARPAGGEEDAPPPEEAEDAPANQSVWEPRQKSAPAPKAGDEEDGWPEEAFDGSILSQDGSPYRQGPAPGRSEPALPREAAQEEALLRDVLASARSRQQPPSFPREGLFAEDAPLDSLGQEEPFPGVQAAAGRPALDHAREDAKPWGLDSSFPETPGGSFPPGQDAQARENAPDSPWGSVGNRSPWKETPDAPLSQPHSTLGREPLFAVEAAATLSAVSPLARPVPSQRDTLINAPSGEASAGASAASDDGESASFFALLKRSDAVYRQMQECLPETAPPPPVRRTVPGAQSDPFPELTFNDALGLKRLPTPNPFPHIFPNALFTRLTAQDGSMRLEGEWRRGSERFRIVAVPGSYAPQPPASLPGFTRYIRSRAGGFWVRVSYFS